MKNGKLRPISKTFLFCTEGMSNDSSSRRNQ